MIKPSILYIICIDGVTVGPSEAEYHESLADPDLYFLLLLLL
jgi:hypothetical protein